MIVTTVALLASGIAFSEANQEQIFEGTYVAWFEVSRFTPTGTNERWWLRGHIPCVEKYDAAHPLDEVKDPPVFIVKVRGTRSPDGHYGHLGSYSHEFTVTETLECRIQTAGE